MSTLSQLIEHQWEVSCEVAGGEPRATRISLAQYALALISEVIELAQEVNWKPWKRDVPVDKTTTLDELADVWAFALLYTKLIMQLTDATAEEVEAAYYKKTTVTQARARGEVVNYGRKEVIENAKTQNNVDTGI